MFGTHTRAALKRRQAMDLGSGRDPVIGSPPPCPPPSVCCVTNLGIRTYRFLPIRPGGFDRCKGACLLCDAKAVRPARCGLPRVSSRCRAMLALARGVANARSGQAVADGSVKPCCSSILIQRGALRLTMSAS